MLSLADGSVRWETDPKPSYLVVVADEELVVTFYSDTVTAYAINDGTRQWQQTLDDIQLGGGPLGGAPYLGTQVYLTHETDDGEGVIALDRTTGTVRWQKLTGYQVRQVEPSADAVFVGSHVDDPDGGIKAPSTASNWTGRGAGRPLHRPPTLRDSLSSKRRFCCRRSENWSHWIEGLVRRSGPTIRSPPVGSG